MFHWQAREGFMERTQVDSSNIRSIGYNPQSRILEVEFTSGDIYQYFDIPERLYEELMRATSHGGFLDENIVKFNYRYQKIK